MCYIDLAKYNPYWNWPNVTPQQVNPEKSIGNVYIAGQTEHERLRQELEILKLKLDIKRIKKELEK